MESVQNTMHPDPFRLEWHNEKGNPHLQENHITFEIGIYRSFVVLYFENWSYLQTAQHKSTAASRSQQVNPYFTHRYLK